MRVSLPCGRLRGRCGPSWRLNGSRSTACRPRPRVLDRRRQQHAPRSPTSDACHHSPSGRSPTGSCLSFGPTRPGSSPRRTQLIHQLAERCNPGLILHNVAAPTCVWSWHRLPSRPFTHRAPVGHPHGPIAQSRGPHARIRSRHSSKLERSESLHSNSPRTRRSYSVRTASIIGPSAKAGLAANPPAGGERSRDPPPSSRCKHLER